MNLRINDRCLNNQTLTGGERGAVLSSSPHLRPSLTERKSLVGFGTRQGLRSPITSRTWAVSEPSSTMSSTLVPTTLEASRIQPLIVDSITQKPTEAGVSIVYAFDPRECRRWIKLQLYVRRRPPLTRRRAGARLDSRSGPLSGRNNGQEDDNKGRAHSSRAARPGAPRPHRKTASRACR